MKKIILLTAFFLMSVWSYAQENCSPFKTGHFQNIENGVLKAKIQRNDSIQKEQYGEKEITLKILWIDDCTYRLKFQEGNQAFWNGRPKNQSTPDLVVKITNVDGNTYTQESKFEGDDKFVYKSVITKVE